jgi:hypothetical protein
MPHTHIIDHAQCCFITHDDLTQYLSWAKVEARRRVGDRMEEGTRLGEVWSLQYRHKVYLQVLASLLGARGNLSPDLTSEEGLETWLSALLSLPGSFHQIPASAYQVFSLLFARSLRGGAKD